jgi:hypothetical protein
VESDILQSHAREDADDLEGGFFFRRRTKKTGKIIPEECPADEGGQNDQQAEALQ